MKTISDNQKLNKCRLCLEEKPLIKKSHIIPQWMYFGLFDQKHKIAMVDLDTGTSTRPSTGLYEGNIFCPDCDNRILGSLEHHGKQTLCVDNKFINFFSSKDFVYGGSLKSAVFPVKDYLKFKLFLVSLLWKMHVSSLPFFSQVNLDAHDSERLRHAIFNNEKIGQNEYEVAVIGIQPLPELITNLIHVPRKVQDLGSTYYIALINGLYFMFNVSRDIKTPLIVKSRLMEDGYLKIPLLEGDLARIFYDSLSKVQIRRREL